MIHYCHSYEKQSAVIHYLVIYVIHIFCLSWMCVWGYIIIYGGHVPRTPPPSSPHNVAQYTMCVVVITSLMYRAIYLWGLLGMYVYVWGYSRVIVLFVRRVGAWLYTFHHLSTPLIAFIFCLCYYIDSH